MPHLECTQPPFGKPIGAWRLHPGHAMSLRPKKAAVLRVYCGKVWVTAGAGQAGISSDSGDWFLGPGDVLMVPAGARMVIEPMSPCGDLAPVHFDWSDQIVVPSRFVCDVAQPAGEVAAALLQAGVALMRMLTGILGYGEFLVAGRGKVLSRLESMRS